MASPTSQKTPAQAKQIATKETRAEAEVGIRPWEWLCLVLILAVAAYLRFGKWHLLEFKADEAIALSIALDFIKHGHLPLAGLMSSVGVTNPPLFSYLIIPAVAINPAVEFVTFYISLTGIAAVGVCWHIGRKYYGKVVGAAAAALFAVSPWAVIYSRKIWAQDWVPIFSALTLLAVHALTLGKRPRAIFWVILLSSCIIQIHFSGFALTAAVLTILVLIRPQINWRFAIGGVIAAAISWIPYLCYQVNNRWADFRQMFRTIGGNPNFNPQDLFIHPLSGYPLASHHYLAHAISIINAGEINDLLGLSTPKFEGNLTFGLWPLWIEQFAFVAGVIYLIWRTAAGFRFERRIPFLVVSAEAQPVCILAAWILVPLLVYAVAHIGALMSYFVIFFPAPFLICAVAAKWFGNRIRSQLTRAGGAILLAILLLGNMIYVSDLYKFLDRNQGAFGSYGTPLGYKQQAANFLAAHIDVHELMSQNRLAQIDQFGRIELPQPDVPLLASLDTSSQPKTKLSEDLLITLVDRNRANFTAEQWAQLSAIPHQTFGPLEIYFLQRNSK